MIATRTFFFSAIAGITPWLNFLPLAEQIPQKAAYAIIISA
jgi:hypothetical protein